MATTALQKNIPLKVLPVALNYSSFKKFGKEVHLFFGEEITANTMEMSASHGKQLLDFNFILQNQLQHLVYEIAPKDKVKLRHFFPVKRNSAFYLLLLPAMAGFLLHAPLFYVCKLLTELRFKHSGHYDSVLTSLLLIGYPFYVLAAIIMAYFIEPWLAFLALIIFPFTAWACMRVKDRI